MDIWDLDFNVDIADVELEAYQNAAEAGDLATIKHILLGNCEQDDAQKIEQLLPVELIRFTSGN